jgi:23S rRNA (pseudouridine1915-N3)-methyltransferase
VQIQILAVGKIKEDYLKRGINDYISRISKHAKVTITEVLEEDIASGAPHDIMAKEAKKLLKQISKRDSWYIIALDREGIEISSEQLSKQIEALMVQGKSNIMFVIGGALGIDRSLIDLVDFRLSLSKLTFTHQFARLLLLEQVYRSLKIIRGEPYHY